MMWSFWSRDPTKDFGYEIGDVVPGFQEKSIWVLHKGKKKATGDPVSIFRYEVKPNSDDHMDRAKSAVKRLKTLRHPCILTYLDSLESDKFILIVTEYVDPLEIYLENTSNYTAEQKLFAISWGLHQVSRGLGFLINDCNLNHNNMFIGSVFVNCQGSWRIGGLEYVIPTSDDYFIPKMTQSLAIYIPSERIDSLKKISTSKWASDSWGLGCLIWEIFNGPLPERTSLKKIGKIPKSLASKYIELISANPKSRPSPLDFIDKCRAPSGFFKNSFIDSMLFLEEIQIKEPGERNRFFSNLDSQLDSFPEDACKNKILPQLVTAFEFSNAGSAILGPLFKIGKLLNETEYQKKILPCVLKLFVCKDRATRAKLLQQMELFVHYFHANMVNDQVFPQVAQGFLDSNATIREQTVKCMLHLAPKLNYNNLNEEVLKHFARLQSRDEEGGIRTNTTVCLGKIACHLHPQIRQTVLISAFLRSMRDPFPPARIAGILALSATQNFYSLRDTATRIMPALCHLTMDKEKSVRDQAFKALRGFISKIEKVSEDPTLAEQMEADINAAGSTVSTTLAASWAGWAVSSLAAKFYRSKTPQPAPNIGATKSIETSEKDKINKENDISVQKSQNISQDSGSEYGEDIWGTIENENLNTSQMSPPVKLDGWESEDWDNLNTENEKNEEKPPVSKNEPQDFFDALNEEVNNRNSTSTHRISTSKSLQIITENENELKKSLNREAKKEKMINKTRDIEEKTRNLKKQGPMKLGAQKIS